MSPKIFVLCVVLVCASAAPPIDVVPLEKQQPTVIPIIAQSEELEANGTYKFSYETANGIKREEISYDKVLPSAKSGGSSNEGGEEKSDESNEIHVQQGSYSYTAPDGTVISVRYIADENGFRPIGDHLPKPPSILVAASPSGVSGRTAKKVDSDVGSSAPVAAIAAPATSLAPAAAAPATLASESDANIPSVKSRIADTSAGQASNSASEVSQESSTSAESPSSTEVPSTAEPSTTESSTTTEQSSTTEFEQSTSSEAASTTASEQSTTSEAASTTASEQSTTSEAALTTASEQSTTEAASTLAAESSTTEQASTSNEISTLPASTPNATTDESTLSSDAATTAAP